MKIVMAGATGFLGRPLADALVAAGHQVTVLTRPSSKSQPDKRVTYVTWTPDGTVGKWASSLDGVDVVVNLAGESIATKPWTAEQKDKIRQSRLNSTKSLVEAINAMMQPPRGFISASAVGYYGLRGGVILRENSPPGTDFLAQLCMDWEQEAERASSEATRVATIRTGIVLAKDGGVLQRMITPFRFFIGGFLGNGKQYMSWIHKDDWVHLVEWMIENDAVTGAVNATAPEPVTNLELSKALGRAMRRPCALHTPAFMLRRMLGREAAEALLLNGQRVIPQRALNLKFKFKHPKVLGALRDLFAS